MKADYVVYDEHAEYKPPGRRRQKAAERFVLRTHIENRTPYRTSDLAMIVHTVVSQIKSPLKVSWLRFFSGTRPRTLASFIANSSTVAEAWLPGENCDVAWVIEQTVTLYKNAVNGLPDLRERTALLRRILKRTGKIELRRRRGKR